MDISIPAGFQWSAVHCGIKQDASVEDYVLVRCLPQTVAAGVYTRNRVFAAPVAWDRSRTPSADVRAVVVNSGNANACTGDQGWQDVQAMASAGVGISGSGLAGSPRSHHSGGAGVVGYVWLAIVVTAAAMCVWWRCPRR